MVANSDASLSGMMTTNQYGGSWVALHSCALSGAAGGGGVSSCGAGCVGEVASCCCKCASASMIVLRSNCGGAFFGHALSSAHASRVAVGRRLACPKPLLSPGMVEILSNGRGSVGAAVGNGAGCAGGVRVGSMGGRGAERIYVEGCLLWAVLAYLAALGASRMLK